MQESDNGEDEYDNPVEATYCTFLYQSVSFGIRRAILETCHT
jgi:hypothetical protein